VDAQNPLADSIPQRQVRDVDPRRRWASPIGFVSRIHELLEPCRVVHLVGAALPVETARHRDPPVAVCRRCADMPRAARQVFGSLFDALRHKAGVALNGGRDADAHQAAHRRRDVPRRQRIV